MQVTEHSSKLLRFQGKLDPTGFFVLFITSGVFLLVCLLFFEISILKCNRTEPSQIDCELTSSKVFRKRVTTVTGLQTAEVEVSSSSDGDTYRIILVTKNGQIPMTDGYYSPPTGNESRINDFINNQNVLSLNIREGASLFMILVFVGTVVFLFLASVASLFHHQLVSLSFDKVGRKVTFKYRNLLSKTKFRQESLDRIDRAKVYKDSEEDDHLKLILKSGESIDLPLKRDHTQVARMINQFLEAKDY